MLPTIPNIQHGKHPHYTEHPVCLKYGYDYIILHSTVIFRCSKRSGIKCNHLTQWVGYSIVWAILNRSSVCCHHSRSWTRQLWQVWSRTLVYWQPNSTSAGTGNVCSPSYSIPASRPPRSTKTHSSPGVWACVHVVCVRACVYDVRTAYIPCVHTQFTYHTYITYNYMVSIIGSMQSNELWRLRPVSLILYVRT